MMIIPKKNNRTNVKTNMMTIDKNKKLFNIRRKLADVLMGLCDVQKELSETYGEKFDRLIGELDVLDKKISAKISKMTFGREEAMIKYKLYALLRIFADQKDKENVVRILDDCYRKLNYVSVFNTANLLSALSFQLDDVLDDLGDFNHNTSFEFISDMEKSNVRPIISLHCRYKYKKSILDVTFYKEGTVSVDYQGHLLDGSKSGIISTLAWGGKNGLEVEENTTKLGEIVPDIFSNIRWVDPKYYSQS